MKFLEANTPEQLELLPEKTVIFDSGISAYKSHFGAWHYDMGPFEPENFPVLALVDEAFDF